MCGSANGGGGYGAPSQGGLPPGGQIQAPFQTQQPPQQSNGPTGFGAPSVLPPPQQQAYPIDRPMPMQQPPPASIQMPQQAQQQANYPIDRPMPMQPSGLVQQPPSGMPPPQPGFGGFGQQRPSFGPYGSGISPAFSAGNVTGGLTQPNPPPNQNPFAMLWGGY